MVGRHFGFEKLNIWALDQRIVLQQPGRREFVGLDKCNLLPHRLDQIGVFTRLFDTDKVHNVDGAPGVARL